jgi:ferredoxin
MPTPFGLRRRLRRLLGQEVLPVTAAPPPSVEAAPRPARVHLTVVAPNGSEASCEAPVDSTVLAASAGLRRPLAAGCSDSTCGTCRFEVLAGGEGLSPQDSRERATLRESGHDTAWRLACRAELREGAAVRVRAFELV